jgi:hypothetical protein
MMLCDNALNNAQGSESSCAQALQVAMALGQCKASDGGPSDGPMTDTGTVSRDAGVRDSGAHD